MSSEILHISYFLKELFLGFLLVSWYWKEKKKSVSFFQVIFLLEQDCKKQSKERSIFLQERSIGLVVSRGFSQALSSRCSDKAQWVIICCYSVVFL